MNWLVLIAYGVLLWALSPRALDRKTFFEGRDRGGSPVGFWLLTGSVLVSWVFAKSITNAANLGASFGLTGGLAYAGWYLSIPVAGVVICGMRRRLGVDSLVEFLIGRYGRLAALTFMLAIFVRLFNEIWSNTMVVGTYFGPKGSTPYYVACAGFTGITLLYSLRGGLRSSIVTDGIQVVLMVFFIALVLGYVVPGRSGELMSAGEMSMAGGLDLLLVALLQSLSYPFHDPVLTDRAFITDTETTLSGYLTAGGLGVLCIVVFSLVGVYAFVGGMGIQDDAPPRVARSLGVTVLVLMNVVMLTSAGSTIDSTFASLAREFAVDVPDLGGWFEPGDLRVGRTVMVVMAVLGNLPLLTEATILRATTLSGTMVMGLAPVFLCYAWSRPGPPAFHLAFWFGFGVGLYDLLGDIPAALSLGSGSYAGLLGANLYGFIGCWVLFVLGAMLGEKETVP